jgi:hypothetical protein
MATFYGSDTACVTDVGLIDLQVTSPARIIGERIARLWQSPRGTLGLGLVDPAAANRGYDIRQLPLMKLTPSTIAQAQQQLANEALKDEEVASVNVVITASNGVITITGSFTSAAGPFTLTGNVSAFTAPQFFIS